MVDRRRVARILLALLGLSAVAVLAQVEQPAPPPQVQILPPEPPSPPLNPPAAAPPLPGQAVPPAAAPAEHAAETGGEHEEEPASELAIEHGSWFYPISHGVDKALGFDLLSGYMLVGWVVMALLVICSAKATARIRAGDLSISAPTGLQNAMELAVEGLGNFAESMIGPHGRKYTPLIGTFFLYILLCNWIAVIPGFVAPTSTLNWTVALGLSAFLAVQAIAIRTNGMKGYLLHFAGSPNDFLGWCLAPLMFVLEVIGELVKPLSLSMRLFGNIFGEDSVVLQIALFMLGLGGWHFLHHKLEGPPGSWVMGIIPAHLPMMAFSLFGGLIQALVFSMLVCIYISLLTSHESEHGHDEEHGHGHGDEPAHG